MKLMNLILLFKNTKVVSECSYKYFMSMLCFIVSPSTSTTPCFILFSDGGPVVSLQWSPSFTSQHVVERYRVVVTPDPSSCCSQQVSPSENYKCSGLVLGTDYSFKVSAINCGNQEGTRETFTIQPQGVLKTTHAMIACIHSHV